MPLMVPYRLGRLGVMLPIDGGVSPYFPIRSPYTAPMPGGNLRPAPAPGQICPSWGCAGNGITGVVSVQGAPAVAVVPTTDGSTPITAPGAGNPAAAPTVVVSPTSGPIPPPSTPIIAAPAGFDLGSFLTGSIFGGIPNWVLLGGLALFLVEGDHK